MEWRLVYRMADHASQKPENKLRINRYLAKCGIGSRREAEKYISSGRVTVNGQLCMEFSVTVQPGVDKVTLDGKALEVPGLYYYKCYKPTGILTTHDDPFFRRTIREMIRREHIPEGVTAAGRLDLDSEGLLVLTNDGDVIQRLTHPSFGVRKTYRVLIERWPMESDLKKLLAGVKCNEYTAKAEEVIRLGPQPRDIENPSHGYWLEIVLTEGKKREIREMLASLRYNVMRLVRIKHGPIELGTIQPGEIKVLEEWEENALRDLVDAQTRNAPEP